MTAILVSLAIVVAGILVATSMQRRPAGPAYPVPPMGMLNPNGGWVTPIDGDTAVQQGRDVTVMATPNYSYVQVKAKNVTVGSAQATLVDRCDKDGNRIIGGSSRQDLIRVGP
jgi:hypothetical protein